MPPTRAAARKTYLGLSAEKNLSTAPWLHKSRSARAGSRRFRIPAAFNLRTIAEPTSPVWPATKMRSLSFMGLRSPISRSLQHGVALGVVPVRVDHLANQLIEADLGLPAKHPCCLAGVADQ